MKLNVRLNDVPDMITRTPDGDYVFCVNNVDYRPNRKNEDMVVITSEIVSAIDADEDVEEAVKGRTMNSFFTIEAKDEAGKLIEDFTSKRLSRFKKFAADCGVEWEDDAVELDDFLNAEFVGRVGPQNNNPQYSEIKSTYPVD